MNTMEIKLSERVIANMVEKYRIKVSPAATPYEKRQAFVGAICSLPERHQFTILRKNEGMTQQQFADKIGVCMEAISHYERGAYEPPQSIHYIKSFIQEKLKP